MLVKIEKKRLVRIISHNPDEEDIQTYINPEHKTPYAVYVDGAPVKAFHRLLPALKFVQLLLDSMDAPKNIKCIHTDTEWVHASWNRVGPGEWSENKYRR